LDAYIKSLLSTPAPGGGTEEDGRSPPPAPGVSTATGGSSWARSDRRAAERLSSLTIVCGLGSVDVAPKVT
ncbi:unnamed protein product, partial [Ectocarpus sp. 12 AP-2014]